MRWTLPVALILLPGCQPAKSPEPTLSEDSLKVASTIIAFNDALASADTASLAHLAAPGFTLLQDGQRYDLQGAQEAVIGAFQHGAMSRQMGPQDTRVDGVTAHTRYAVDVRSITDRDTLRGRRIESLVLERDDEGWKVASAMSEPDTAGGGTP